MGLIFSLFDVASFRDVPFGISQYLQCTHHGLTFVLAVIDSWGRANNRILICGNWIVAEALLLLLG